MNRDTQADPAPRGITTLDLLLFTAGFACGWVMHQSSALLAGEFYILPFSRGDFHSLLGTVWIGWLWAVITGLAFLAVGRRFRYDCRDRRADWLSVALAILLFESACPAFRPERVGSMTGEIVCYEAPASLAASAKAVAYHLWWPQDRETWEELCAGTLRMTAAAMVVAVACWRLRSKLNAGWVAVMIVAAAVLLALGPIRMAEATSIEVSSSAPFPGYQPGLGQPLENWSHVAAHFDARAWAGYSLRAVALLTVAILAVRNLVKRWRHWLWPDWAALGSAAIIAGCWVYDEFVARPALDKTVRIALLGAWLLALAAMAAALIWAWSVFGKRLRGRDAIGDQN
jgi:hypothetical protein